MISQNLSFEQRLYVEMEDLGHLANILKHAWWSSGFLRLGNKDLNKSFIWKWRIWSTWPTFWNVYSNSLAFRTELLNTSLRLVRRIWETWLKFWNVHLGSLSFWIRYPESDAPYGRFLTFFFAHWSSRDSESIQTVIRLAVNNTISEHWQTVTIGYCMGAP